MPKSQFLNFREIVRSAVETPHESEDILLLAGNFRAPAEEALGVNQDGADGLEPVRSAWGL